MLNIVWGRENLTPEQKKNFVLDNRIWFRRNKKPEWFEDPFVKGFLEGIDKTTVLFEEALKDYRGRGISTEMISSGSKTLCCLYYNQDTKKIFYGSLMGNNCLPYLLEIAKKKDITIVLEHYADFPEECFDTGLIQCKGKVLNQRTYDDSFSEWSASTQEDDYLDRL